MSNRREYLDAMLAAGWERESHALWVARPWRAQIGDRFAGWIWRRIGIVFFPSEPLFNDSSGSWLFR